MAGGIYLIQNDDSLVQMTEQPYDLEERLQILLADYPNILAGDQINSAAPRRWLFIQREFGVPAKQDGGTWWSLDHLFLDQDSIPTLVEVKRSVDTRSRREVVAQMLDYAANAVVYWPIGSIQAAFEATCRSRELDPSEILTDFLEGSDVQGFWQRANENLQAGKIRMLFVADAIAPELQRIVEFLNGQMNRAEVLAVEIKQFVGQGLKTLVPRVIGQTSEAQQTKSAGVGRQWDEESYLEALQSADKDIAGKIIDWSRGHDLTSWWGKGQKYGSWAPVLVHAGTRYVALAMWTNGYISVQFPHMKPPFDTIEAKEDLARRLRQIDGVSLSEDAILKYPSIWLSALKSERSLKSFFDTFDWIIESYRAGKLIE